MSQQNVNTMVFGARKYQLDLLNAKEIFSSSCLPPAAAPHRGLLRSLLLLAVESHALTIFGRRYYILPGRIYSTVTGTTSPTPHTPLLLPACRPQMAWSGVCVPQSVLPLNVGIHCVGVHVLTHMGMCAMPGVDIKLF